MNKIILTVVWILAFFSATGIIYFSALQYSAYGWYDPYLKNIIINAADTDNRLAVFLHEDCHYLWFEEMTQEERDNYTNLYEQKEHPKKSNVKEDWAENCSTKRYEELIG